MKILQPDNITKFQNIKSLLILWIVRINDEKSKNHE